MEYRFENLRVEDRGDRLFVVTVDRPKVLNALNDATIAEIDRCFEQLGSDPAVGAVVLTGGGEKAFVAGADIKELAEQSPFEAKTRALAGQKAFLRVEQLGKPVIAAIGGYALGGGLELALACHTRVASSRAKLGLPEVSLGIIPGYGGTQRLPRLVGRGMALRAILGGDPFDAEEAHRIGLVDQVVEPEELMAAAEKWARRTLSRGPVALRLALEAVLRGQETSLDEGLEIEADLFGLISATEDMREGMKAFLEKRAAEFKNQ